MMCKLLPKKSRISKDFFNLALTQKFWNFSYFYLFLVSLHQNISSIFLSIFPRMNLLWLTIESKIEHEIFLLEGGTNHRKRFHPFFIEFCEFLIENFQLIKCKKKCFSSFFCFHRFKYLKVQQGSLKDVHS